MIKRWGEALKRPRVAAPALICAAFFLVTVCEDAAAQAQPAQPAQAQPPAATPPAAAPPAAQPPRQKEGFFDAIGRWWDKSAADFDANLKKMKSQMDAANDRNAQAAREAAAATKEATDALVKFPSTRLVEGRERCQLAPNGSPDCGPAAEAICKAKGFASGKSANIESARKCSARAILSRSEQDCVNETIVTSAACQ